MLQGKKTFLAAAAMIAYAIAGAAIGAHDISAVMPTILEALAIIALRLGLAKG